MCYLCATMAQKSKPTGIRFDLEKVNLIKEKEKLTTNQQVVDFLMNRYWWEHKLAIPTYKDVPPLPNTILEHKIKEEEKGSSEIITVAQYVLEKREIEHPEEYKKFLTRVDGDINLTFKDKQLIKNS